MAGSTSSSSAWWRSYLLGSGAGASAVRFDGLASLGAGFTASIDGWPILTGTHPPIDASGPVLLPIVLLCLLASGLGAGLAMRSEVAARPLIPLVLLLVAALLLSRAEPVRALLHGVAFGVVALLWLRARGAQSEVPGGDRAPGRRARALAAGAMVAVGALVATVVVGISPTTDRLVLRGALPAYDVAGLRTHSTASATTLSAARPPSATSSARSC